MEAHARAHNNKDAIKMQTSRSLRISALSRRAGIFPTYTLVHFGQRKGFTTLAGTAGAAAVAAAVAGAPADEGDEEDVEEEAAAVLILCE
jgi:hypothetical protein